MCALMLCISAFVSAQSTTSPATRPAGTQRWEEKIAEFERQDRESPPPKDGILFVGSSSIAGWKLKEFFPDLPVINRGFGGSQIADSLFYVDRIVLPPCPRVIVFYAGENDIVAGKPPHAVAEDFRQFVGRVRAALPQAKIIFIGLKPSPSRWKFIDDFRETNKLITRFIQGEPGMVYIDVERVMLDDEGKPREELFLKDRLHMTRAGYELWTELVRPHVGVEPAR